jgi:hypothetical protein
VDRGLSSLRRVLAKLAFSRYWRDDPLFPCFSCSLLIGNPARGGEFFLEHYCLRVCGAKDLFGVAGGLLVQRDCVGKTARRLICTSEVVPRGQGVRVFGAENPFGVGQRLLYRRTASEGRPANS